jgi:hypothetical protein
MICEFELRTHVLTWGSVSSRSVTIKGYRFIRNDRMVRSRPNTDGGGVGMYIKNGLKHRVVCQSVEVGVEFLFVAIRFSWVLCTGYLILVLVIVCWARKNMVRMR